MLGPSLVESAHPFEIPLYLECKVDLERSDLWFQGLRVRVSIPSCFDIICLHLFE